MPHASTQPDSHIACPVRGNVLLFLTFYESFLKPFDPEKGRMEEEEKLFLAESRAIFPTENNYFFDVDD